MISGGEPVTTDVKHLFVHSLMTKTMDCFVFATNRGRQTVLRHYRKYLRVHVVVV